MIILAIETSCDDTCVAILEAKGKERSCFKILSNIVSSQTSLHAKYGGIYPFLAKREHQRNLPIVLRKAFREAGFEISNFQFLISKQIPKTKLKIPKIDVITVTVGPGLEPCLWTGVNFAKELAEKMKLPLVPVNHIEAHILANFVGENPKFESNPLGSPLRVQRNSKFLFPAICLIVSGGHTQLILMKDSGRHPPATQYKIIGETRDDAAGECFDKTARILGLGYPGGPAIAAKTTKLKTTSYKLKTNLPRPMIYQKNYDFSFSGLKTAVLYKVQSMKHEETKKKEFIEAMCREIQQAIIDVLIHKTIRAAKEYKAKTIILGGGVAANEELRKQLEVQSSKLKVNFLAPPKNFCTDNAAMVAVTAYYSRFKGKTKTQMKIEADANLRL